MVVASSRNYHQGLSGSRRSLTFFHELFQQRPRVLSRIVTFWDHTRAPPNPKINEAPLETARSWFGSVFRGVYILFVFSSRHIKEGIKISSQNESIVRECGPKHVQKLFWNHLELHQISIKFSNMLHVGTYIPETLEQKTIVVWLMVLLGEFACIDQHISFPGCFMKCSLQKSRTVLWGKNGQLLLKPKKACNIKFSSVIP